MWLDFLYIFFVLKYYPDNYSPCRLWEKPRSEWKYYYGSNYDPYQRKKLQRVVQPPEYEILFKDKWITDALCQHANIPTPSILGKIKPSEPFQERVDELFNLHQNLSELIIKPVDGKGGGGVVYCQRQDAKIRYLQGQTEIDLKGVLSERNYIVQSFIQQHPAITRISGSTNTVRIVTLLQDNDEVLVIGAYMRFGTGQSKVDNLSQGGLCVPIDPKKGKLRQTGSDRKSRLYFEHPDSKIMFEGVEVPFWENVVDLASDVQRYFECYRLLGMDIAIAEDGPLLIEINSSYDNVDLEQATGPILRSEPVVKAYSQLDLLINRHQRDILDEYGVTQ
ncbi:sugar-transfer associated ATP-grasp domain-containing protein [Halovibrio salipaludis]|uniref:sugar-transfer associated ATP-grasp domain-containing protein n=1 Tax=Halovibrio salipaludis TaxID=2032626 RepID=UPI0013047A4A|nr:sugar-transfer associated ATP-grasp domain-containing protein [Halovibrio salipaludis]